MSPLVAALLGLLAGLLVGAAIMVGVVKSRVEHVTVEEPIDDGEVGRIIRTLRSGVAVVGPHDELLTRNEAAEKLGLVRGTRVAIPAVLEAIRESRQDGLDASIDLDHTQGRGRPQLRLAVRVLPLEGGRVFVAADDRSPEVRAFMSGRDFMTNATHELKTPIGAISLLAEALEDAPDDPDAVARFAGKIRSEGQRLGALVSQIITLSRLQETQSKHVEKVSVGILVSDAMLRCQHLASGRNVSLTSNGPTELWVWGDSGQLTTALENLIQNAINYSDHRARVVVTSRTAVVDGDDWVELAVSDNGIGIAKAEQERIFERFYRVDYARSRETGGTGLGLSIVSQIATSHGGTVSVWSQPGAGSTFTLRFPAATPDEEEEEA